MVYLSEVVSDRLSAGKRKPPPEGRFWLAQITWLIKFVKRLGRYGTQAELSIESSTPVKGRTLFQVITADLVALAA